MFKEDIRTWKSTLNIFIVVLVVHETNESYLQTTKTNIAANINDPNFNVENIS